MGLTWVPRAEFGSQGVADIDLELQNFMILGCFGESFYHPF